jgi:hypothetical protein
VRSGAIKRAFLEKTKKRKGKRKYDLKEGRCARERERERDVKKKNLLNHRRQIAFDNPMADRVLSIVLNAYGNGNSRVGDPVKVQSLRGTAAKMENLPCLPFPR